MRRGELVCCERCHSDPDVLMYMEALWGTTFFDVQQDDRIVNEGLHMLLEQCDGRLWNIERLEDFSTVATPLPIEMPKRCEFNDFRVKHHRLSEWLQTVQSMPFGHEFFTLGKH